MHDHVRDLVVSTLERPECVGPACVVHDGSGDVLYAIDQVAEAALVDGVKGEAGNDGQGDTGPDEGDGGLNVLDFEAPAQRLPTAAQRIIDDDPVARLGADSDQGNFRKIRPAYVRL